jgi:hypothetical protein
MTKTFKYPVIIGLGYGAVLCLIGILVAGFGHGTYALLGLAGAPFSFLGTPIAIIATLFQWWLLAVACQKMHLPKPYFIGFLFAHYVAAAALLLLPSSDFADWEYVRRIPQSYRLLLAFGFVWYLIGQMVVWKVLVTGQRTPGKQ